MPRLIWVFAGRSHFVGFVMRRLKFFFFLCLTCKNAKLRVIYCTAVHDLHVGMARHMSQIMRLWYFLSSVNSFFKRACTAIQWVWILVGPFVYFHTLCVWTAKALARLCECTGLPEPLLVAYVISTIISWAGTYGVKISMMYSFLNISQHKTYVIVGGEQVNGMTKISAVYL